MNSVVLALLFAIQTGIVEGRILTADGVSAVKTRVALQAVAESVAATAAAPVLTSIAQTDGDGRYRLEGVTPGRYYIVAGPIDLPTYYPGAITLGEARVIAVGAEARLTEMDIALALAGPLGKMKVGGRVIREGPPGARGPAQQVQLTQAGLAGLTRIQKVANIAPDGSFELRDISPGLYTIGLAPAGGFEPQRLDVRARDVYVDLVEPLTAAIAGKIAIEDAGPIPRVSLTFADDRNRGRSVGVFGNTDTMTVLLRPGTYAVDWTALPAGYSVKSLVSGSTNLLTSPLRVMDATPQDLVMTLGVSSPPPWVRVSGRIRSVATELGRPLSGGNVTMSGAGITLQTRPKPDGTFAFPRVISGAYVVRTNLVPRPRPDSLEITVGRSNVEDLELVVPNFVELPGQVTMESGGEFSRPTFSVHSGTNTLGVTGAVIRPDGAFTFALPAGQFQITLNRESISGYVVKEMTYGLMNALVEPITVDSLDLRTTLRITLAPRP